MNAKGKWRLHLIARRKREKKQYAVITFGGQINPAEFVDIDVSAVLVRQGRIELYKL